MPGAIHRYIHLTYDHFPGRRAASRVSSPRTPHGTRSGILFITPSGSAGLTLDPTAKGRGDELPSRLMRDRGGICTVLTIATVQRQRSSTLAMLKKLPNINTPLQAPIGGTTQAPWSGNVGATCESRLIACIEDHAHSPASLRSVHSKKARQTGPSCAAPTGAWHPHHP